MLPDRHRRRSHSRGKSRQPHGRNRQTRPNHARSRAAVQEAHAGMSHQIAISRHGVPIRLTEERWLHIIEEHAELADLRDEVLLTVSQAERVIRGTGGELLAVRTNEPGKAFVAVYRETDIDDGFLITAFVTRRLKSL